MILEKKKLSNWSHSKFIKTKIYYPKDFKELKDLIKYFKKKKIKVSIMGNGNTYGDSFLNPNGRTISTKYFNKIHKLDLKKNYVDVGSGIKLNKLLNYLLVKKKIINNIPGSYNVTIGGCISSNVHGKDSFKYGIFGNNLISIKLINQNGDISDISYKDKNFKNYIGCFGTNGLILSARIKISSIKYNHLKVQTIKFYNIKELLKLFENHKNNSYYMGAWVNHFSDNGLGIFKSSNWNKSKLYLKKINNEYNFVSNLIIKLIYPILRKLIKRKTIKFLNYLLFLLISNKHNQEINFKDFYYPQEKYMPKHSLLYEGGKINIQILIPKKKFIYHYNNIKKICKKFSYESWWLGIKMHKKSKFDHSFNLDGYDMTLQWSKKYIEEKKFKIFYKLLINYMSKNKIILYHSKDILLNKNYFKKLDKSKSFKKIVLNKNKVFNNFILQRLN